MNDVFKVVVFVLLAAVVTWRLPPYVTGLSAAWWARFVLSVFLWMFALDRLWSGAAAAWGGNGGSFNQLGSAALFALIVALLTWYTIPKTPNRG